jgi:hypothetical protein
MQLSQGIEETKMMKAAANEERGLAGWLFRLLQGWRGEREVQQRQMRLVETLALGGKRQLMLVRCCGEQFLVGGGIDSVETIVRVQAEDSLGHVAKNPDEICR